MTELLLNPTIPNQGRLEEPVWWKIHHIRMSIRYAMLSTTGQEKSEKQKPTKMQRQS